MAKTTSTERMRKLQSRLNAIAQQHGYTTWSRLSTAVLHGKLKIVQVEEVKPNLSNDM